MEYSQYSEAISFNCTSKIQRRIDKCTRTAVAANAF